MSGSEKLTWAWAQDAPRVCNRCGREITRLQDIGEVGSRPDEQGRFRRFLRCYECVVRRKPLDVQGIALDVEQGKVDW